MVRPLRNMNRSHKTLPCYRRFKSVVVIPGKTCPALTVPSNGKIWPDFCQVRGNSYEGKCYYQCNNNYNALGENTRVCQADGTWNTPVNPFKCVQSKKHAYIYTYEYNPRGEGYIV